MAGSSVRLDELQGCMGTRAPGVGRHAEAAQAPDWQGACQPRKTIRPKGNRQR